MHSGCLKSYSVNSSEETQAANQHLYRDSGRLMRRLPLFPFKSLVLPGGYLRVKIIEQHHIAMVSACIRHGGGFGSYLDNGASEACAAQVIRHGTMVNIVDWDREGDGLLVIVVEGLQRFCVVEAHSNSQGLANSKGLANSNGLVIGEVEMLPPEKKVALPSCHRELSDLLRRVYNRVKPFIEYASSNYADAAWVSNRLTELLPMTVGERDSVIAMSDPLERLLVLQGIVERFAEAEISVNRSENTIGVS